MSHLAIGLQVRLDSIRLPRKALFPLRGRSVVEHAMEALSELPGTERFILTDQASVEVLEPLGARYGFEVIPGPEEDVLRRYAMMAERSGADIIVRATGDNPLVSPRMARKAIELIITSRADLAAFDNLPLGTGVEVLRREAVLRADAEAVDPREREHVTLHLYNHPERYRIDRRPAPPEASMPEARVTLDTEEDYEFLRELFRRAYSGRPLEVEQVIAEVRELIGSGEGTACRR
ncbi:MAG: cytidylyltransferase domain-containing protein [Alkalispirochaetaceae bacterium]